ALTPCRCEVDGKLTQRALRRWFRGEAVAATDGPNSVALDDEHSSVLGRARRPLCHGESSSPPSDRPDCCSSSISTVSIARMVASALGGRAVAALQRVLTLRRLQGSWLAVSND